MNSMFKRHFSISDGIILIATIAISLACLREFDAETRFWQPHAWARPLLCTMLSDLATCRRSGAQPDWADRLPTSVLGE